MNNTEIIDSLSLLSTQHKLEKLIPAALDLSISLTSAHRAFLILRGPDGELSIKSARNREKQDLAEDQFDASGSIIRKTIEEREPIFLPRLLDDVQFSGAPSVHKLKLQSAICIPLVSSTNTNGDLLGVLYIDSASKGNPLRQEQLQLMKAVANHIAISLENARLFEELEEKNNRIAELNSQLQKRVNAQANSIAGMKMLLAETQRELGRVYALGNLIGKSKAMQEVFKIVQKVSGTEATVLITGESGTGKELVAKFIHFNGPRSEQPIISINCSAFSETLLESELFGHKKGAFTGASENKAGLFQLADQGTLFLDEVGDMSSEMQKKLLRVLEDGEIRPIGGPDVQRVNVRIVAATNRNLQEMVKEEKFREDLYFRLNVIHLHLPPLRERIEDIPLLIEFYRTRIAEEMKKELPPVEDAVLKKFMEYDWPGNVRELVNQLRRYFILESDYTMHHLQPAKSDDGLSMNSAEKNAILKALEVTGGNKKKAAELLGIPRRSFYDKLNKHDIS